MIELVPMSSKMFEEYDPLLRCEYAARVCYNSTGAIKPGTAKEFLKKRLAEGHTTVFEHTRVHVDKKNVFWLSAEDRARATVIPGELVDCYTYQIAVDGNAYLHSVANAPDVSFLAAQYPDLSYFSAEFICSRYIANQMRTHRTLSYCQESLRYVDKTKNLQVVIPAPEYDPAHEGWQKWLKGCEDSHQKYQEMRASGISKESARGILPMDTKTRVFMSGTPYWWGEFFRKRSDDAAQIQLRYLLGTLAVQENVLAHFDKYQKDAMPYLEKLKKFYESVKNA